MPEEERTTLGGAADILSADSAGAAQGLKYPIRGHRFTVEVGKLGVLSCKSVEGFSAEIGTTEYREGAFATLGMRKLPTMLTYPDVTIAKGMYSQLTLYNFFMDYLNGKDISVQEMNIIAYDNASVEIAKWHAINVWPTRYESGGLSADSAEILVETMTFATEGVWRTV